VGIAIVERAPREGHNVACTLRQKETMRESSGLVTGRRKISCDIEINVGDDCDSRGATLRRVRQSMQSQVFRRWQNAGGVGSLKGVL
jgi:hypothetical protein